jgi:hypothetical protein
MFVLMGLRIVGMLSVALAPNFTWAILVVFGRVLRRPDRTAAKEEVLA